MIRQLRFALWKWQVKRDWRRALRAYGYDRNALLRDLELLTEDPVVKQMWKEMRQYA